ncbi:MAG: divergent PAP2 family protein [Oscillospiraceae bacterium]|nr:divergent PAP2 family protein [Oscillospiraceae bacterium]
MQYISEFFSNRIMWTGALGWITAQVLKAIFVLICEKKFDFKRLVGSGGMPSSHSSFVMSLSTAIGLEEGFDSTYFAIAIVISFITMYDAAGVRRAAGLQAKTLNMIMEEFSKGEILTAEIKLKELLGHTPVEVIAGAILGIVIAIIRHA